MANANSKAGKQRAKNEELTPAELDAAGKAIEERLAAARAGAKIKTLTVNLGKLPPEQQDMIAALADRLANKPQEREQPKPPEAPTMHVIPAWLDEKLCSGSPMMQGGSIPDILTQMHAMLELLSDGVMAPDGGSPQGAWLAIRTIQDVIDRLIQHANKNPLYMPKPEKRKAVSHA
ncbi:MAG: hypothetical protein ACM3SS_19685 [Rhodospirillaceae bacterium]